MQGFCQDSDIYLDRSLKVFLAISSTTPTPTPTKANLKAAIDRVISALKAHTAKVNERPDSLQFSKDLAARQIKPVLADIQRMNKELRTLNFFSRSSIRDGYNSRIRDIETTLAKIIAEYDTNSRLALDANSLLMVNAEIGVAQNLALQIPVVQPQAQTSPPGQGSGNAISRSESSSRTSSTPASSPSMYSQPSGIGSNVGPFAHTHSQAPSRHSLASQHSAVQPQMNPPGQGRYFSIGIIEPQFAFQ
ncbi:hypothetical protein D9615_006639 [Tricholomella constricta]|uniref:Uncharacterized protein n=1 Tax=Tricholomella constricta TaxID=117010 RepID=A0A8H5H9L9_9AGAR|nr:hypothetical protein D9615_006639 [Tricholomella constricta]